MNTERAQAYGRVLRAIEDAGPDGLGAEDVARIRAIADALFFDEGGEAGATEAAADATSLARSLAESQGWDDERARALLDDLLGCGELAVVA